MYSSSFVNLRGLFNKILYSVFIYIDVRDRSLFIVQGGIEEKLGGAFKFFKT
jgi:hypothetical protein